MASQPRARALQLGRIRVVQADQYRAGLVEGLLLQGHSSSKPVRGDSECNRMFHQLVAHRGIAERL
jgi:hypothetical protein